MVITRKYTNKRLNISIYTEVQNLFWLLLLEVMQDKEYEHNQSVNISSKSPLRSDVLFQQIRKWSDTNISLAKYRRRIELVYACTVRK